MDDDSNKNCMCIYPYMYVSVYIYIHTWLIIEQKQLYLILYLCICICICIYIYIMLSPSSQHIKAIHYIHHNGTSGLGFSRPVDQYASSSCLNRSLAWGTDLLGSTWLTPPITYWNIPSGNSTFDRYSTLKMDENGHL